MSSLQERNENMFYNVSREIYNLTVLYNHQNEILNQVHKHDTFFHELCLMLIRTLELYEVLSFELNDFLYAVDQLLMNRIPIFFFDATSLTKLIENTYSQTEITHIA